MDLSAELKRKWSTESFAGAPEIQLWEQKHAVLFFGLRTPAMLVQVSELITYRHSALFPVPF